MEKLESFVRVVEVIEKYSIISRGYRIQLFLTVETQQCHVVFLATATAFSIANNIAMDVKIGNSCFVMPFTGAILAIKLVELVGMVGAVEMIIIHHVFTWG
jgi:hypothetical protein